MVLTARGVAPELYNAVVLEGATVLGLGFDV